MDNLDKALARLRGLLRRAGRRRLREPTAMTLATADARGRPSARTVLLKSFDRDGFVFYTNTASRKGRDMAANPRAALCFFWDHLLEQVRVEGKVRRLTDAEADAYWAARARGSQLGAWASLQSERLAGRAVLLRRLSAFRRKFAGKPVPRPPHWSGLRVVPERLEFWKASASRLNKRTVYELRRGRWRVGLLYP